jgi:hypothetical protein
MDVLTERPHRSSLVHLEALYEANAVFLGRSLHGAGVERFVVEVDVFEVLEVLVCIFDAKICLLVSLLGSHGASVAGLAFRLLLVGSSAKVQNAKANSHRSTHTHVLDLRYLQQLAWDRTPATRSFLMITQRPDRTNNGHMTHYETSPSY